MKLSSIPEALQYIWRARKIWVKPKSSTILIYDREGADDFKNYMDFNEVEIFECRGESINLVVLFFAFVKFGVKINMERYALQYIIMVRPQVVITYIDNTITFYQLKKHIPKVKFISIQNGARGRMLFNLLSEDYTNDSLPMADAVFCFGTAVGELYEKNIKTKVYPVGSFRNNNVLKTVSSDKSNTILFLSQFRPPVWHKNKPTMPYGDGHILWDEFYSVESFLLPLLLKFSHRNDYEFKVCGTSFNDDNAEQAYFTTLLGGTGWKYLSKDKDTELINYQRVDEAGCVVFIGSTLGYETLARGVKTAAFPVRGNAVKSDEGRFGWPAKLADKGPFWTNSFDDEKEVERLMKFVTTASDEEWRQASQSVIPKLMGSDPGNLCFVNLLNKYTSQTNNSK
jgi:surface carbohydrate biosynthesis protein